MKAKRKPAGGLITSLHVKEPAVLRRIRRAAKARNESVSQFVLRAADVEALKVLGGPCPSCGTPHAKTSRAA
jgi:hypothetical protein